MMDTKINTLPLGRKLQIFLLALSFVVVACGQPAWSWICGLMASVAGYAVFLRVLLSIKRTSSRFWMATFWAFSVQLVHNSWHLSHPFVYIYAVWLFFSFLCGLQFGLLSFLVSAKRVSKYSGIFLITSTWVVMEWLRLFFMAGYTWNPIGLALTSQLYPLQLASVSGVFGLSFLVMLINLLLLRAWILWESTKIYRPGAAWVLAATLPFIAGYAHLSYHQKLFDKYQADNPKKLSVLLVQPSFLPEEVMKFNDPFGPVQHVIEEWTQILKIVSKHQEEKFDLIALPEYTVPFGTYTPIFPASVIIHSFEELFGKENLKHLPPMEGPWAAEITTKNGSGWYVNNAFLSQAISNIFQAELVIGLEDVDEDDNFKKDYYSAAICFHPNNGVEERYEKRVLVPLAEYIPFSFVKEIAATYGISGSFTPGREAKIFHTSNVPFGCCICYEETFGDMIRESRVKGAELLVNITSDVWYPNSRLPQQHFDHSRLRTVENGIPLVRACNTGITCAVDSLGRMVAMLGEGREDFEWISDALHVEVPLYTYSTAYSRWGDRPLISFCGLIFLSWLAYFRRKY